MPRAVSPNKPLRAHHRVPFDAELPSKVAQLGRATRAQDFSRGGMSMIVPRTLKVGDQLDLELQPTDGPRCIVRAEVCRVEEIGHTSRRKAGLRWVDLDERRRHAVNRCYLTLREVSANESRT